MPVTTTAAAADPDAAAPRARGGTTPRSSSRARGRPTSSHRAAAGRELAEVWAVGPATQARTRDRAASRRTTRTARLDGGELARRLVAARARRVAACSCRAPRRAGPRRSTILRAARRRGRRRRSRTAPSPVAAGDPQLARGTRAARDRPRRGVCACSHPRRSRALAALVGPLARDRARTFAAIGDTTAAALRAAGVAEVAVAAHPDAGGNSASGRGGVSTEVMQLPRLPAAPDATDRERCAAWCARPGSRSTTSSIRCSSCRARASRSRSARCPASSTTRSTRRSMPPRARSTSASRA